MMTPKMSSHKNEAIISKFIFSNDQKQNFGSTTDSGFPPRLQANFICRWLLLIDERRSIWARNRSNREIHRKRNPNNRKKSRIWLNHYGDGIQTLWINLHNNGSYKTIIPRIESLCNHVFLIYNFRMTSFLTIEVTQRHFMVLFIQKNQITQLLRGQWPFWGTIRWFLW